MLKPNFICKPSQYTPLKKANLNSFAALPDELLLEILSHFPPDTTISISAASTTQIIRREVLRSLSDVCQDLRRVFRPYLWQRVEVYSAKQTSEGHDDISNQQSQKSTKNFAKELLRQLNVVTIQDPSLAQYVR
jgi:hypothetical protein